MINGVHALIFAPDADRVRSFLRDVLGLPSVDAGGGWLIFALPPAELGVHPTDTATDPEAGASHEIYLMCDDLEATMDDLRAKGVEFSGGVEDAGWGRMVRMSVPGGGELAMYEPRHPTAITP